MYERQTLDNLEAVAFENLRRIEWVWASAKSCTYFDWKKKTGYLTCSGPFATASVLKKQATVQLTDGTPPLYWTGRSHLDAVVYATRMAVFGPSTGGQPAEPL